MMVICSPASSTEVTSLRRTAIRQSRAIAAVTRAANVTRSTASACPAGTAHSRAISSRSDPARPISSFSSHGAVFSLSDFSEFEHTSSAKSAVWCAGVDRTGRISNNSTSMPRRAHCHAASLPARPAPTILTTFFIPRDVAYESLRHRVPTLVQYRSCVCSHASPLAILVDPRVNKSLAPGVRLPAFHSLGAKHSCRNCGIPEHSHAHRLRHLLLLLRPRLRGCGLYAGKKLRFGLHGPVIVDQHNAVVEKRVQRLRIRGFVGLVPGLLQTSQRSVPPIPSFTAGASRRCENRT